MRDTNGRWYSSATSSGHARIAYAKPLEMQHSALSKYFDWAFDITKPNPQLDEIKVNQAEVSRLMDLIVNSVYSNKEVFLGELIINARDELLKLRDYYRTNRVSPMYRSSDLYIRIKNDEENGTITIKDSGIGMTHQELVDSLGTTKKFLKDLKDSKDAYLIDNLIGQYGVGFYCAFLVADKVVVSTKSVKSDKQYVWEGEANSSSYIIREETDHDKFISTGTCITLHLKRDDKGLARMEKINQVVTSYKQYTCYPIYTLNKRQEKHDEDPSEEIETQPIWLRDPKEVTKEEYNEFYKKTFNEDLEPLAYSHHRTGIHCRHGKFADIKSILYVPAVTSKGKEHILNPKTKNIRLYHKGVFISEDFDELVLPRYLNFVRGVIDLGDILREDLQERRIALKLRTDAVLMSYRMIENISKSDNGKDYVKFWKAFENILKSACFEDGEYPELAPLHRYFSSERAKEFKRGEYVELMKLVLFSGTPSLDHHMELSFLHDFERVNE